MRETKGERGERETEFKRDKGREGGEGDRVYEKDKGRERETEFVRER